VARDSVLIKSCKDSQLWYNNYVGCVFEVIEYDALTKVYWVMAVTGRNIVYEEDCEPWELAEFARGDAPYKVEGALDVETLYHPLLNDYKPKADYTDPVERPSHYTAGNIECIDAIKAATTQEEFEGFLRGNVLKYLWRCNLKSNKTEDLNKARWYLNRLIEETEQ
jgi:hypothetical protein